MNKRFGAGPARGILFALMVGASAVALSGCSGAGLFSPPKIKAEEIVPPDTLYKQALDHMDEHRFQSAIKDLEKLERQHPYSEYTEKSKLMTVYIYYLQGKHDDAVLAADRYLALYPASSEVPYVLYLKGTSLYAQITDITRDQQTAQDAIDVFQRLISSYPKSRYVEDAKEDMRIAYDQLAGKEMSVGRYYEGNGQYTAAINRFRNVVDNYQTSTHVEEALFRLTESYLKLGLVNEATTAAAVLGHNYPASPWYKRAYDLLDKEGVTPDTVPTANTAAKDTGTQSAPAKS